MTPWLSEYVLEKLHSIQNHQPLHNPRNNSSRPRREDPSGPPPPPRLVQILSRGGDWWTNPVLENRLAWLLISDGQESIKAILTAGAMQRILTEMSQLHHGNATTTNNSNTISTYRFYNYSRGCCALMRDYSLDIQKSNMTGTISLSVKVGSIEAKPGFHLMHNNTTNNSGRSGLQTPVGENINVRYALQAWDEAHEKQQQQERSEHEAARHHNSEANVTEARSVKRKRTVPLGDPITTVLNNPLAYNEILRLAEEQQKPPVTGDQNQQPGAQQQRDVADDDGYGTPCKLFETQPATQCHPPTSRGTPDSQNRMSIQNVLMSPDVEEERLNQERDTMESSASKRHRPHSQEESSSPPRTPNSRTPHPSTPHPRGGASAIQFSSSTWEFVKAQLLDPDVKMIVFRQESRKDSSSSNRRLFASPTATPVVTSGAYFRRYGLSRWMRHNVVVTEKAST